MKLLLVRHGESVDDLTDSYGGWADFPLTPKGHVQLRETSKKISALGIKFDEVWSSPLLRASESARIIANYQLLPVKETVYLKEKNGYGLLSGMNKSNAEELYPELFALVKDGYVPGSETEEGFLVRVEKLLNDINESNKTLICVTHGGVLSRLMKNHFNKEIEEAGDGCFILINLENKEIEETDGVKFKQ